MEITKFIKPTPTQEQMLILMVVLLVYQQRFLEISIWEVVTHIQNKISTRQHSLILKQDLTLQSIKRKSISETRSCLKTSDSIQHGDGVTITTGKLLLEMVQSQPITHLTHKLTLPFLR